MAPFPKGNDRRAPRSGPSRGGAGGPRREEQAGGPEWIWGRHAVDAAVANPRRTGLRRLLSAPGKATHLEAGFGAKGLRIERLEANEIGRMLPAGAVHQGLALLADPLEPVSLEELAEPAQGVLVLLDQVADPQNVGAILRSAAAFGARGVILQERRAPTLAGALAK
uniref:TrmH family RNA methyltransferase n=1 Tax=Caulobacter sp. S45 TaxID=1641861 RepID=UPI0027399F9A